MVSSVPYLILHLTVLYFFRWLEEETTVDELENMSKDEKEVTETDPIKHLEEKLAFFKTSMLHMKQEIKSLYDEKNSLEKEKQDLTIKANMQARN